MTTWHRAKDVDGQLYALATVGDRLALYFPEIDESELTVGRGVSRGTRTNPWRKPVKNWRVEAFTVARLDDLRREYDLVELVEARMVPGEYYPRVYRGPEHPPVDVAARTATMRAARNLFSRLRSIFQAVEPIEAHDSVYGHELRQLLLLACTEVESSWRAVLAANRYTHKPAKSWNTEDYVKLLAPMKLEGYALRLASHPGYPVIRPFEGWSASKPTQSLAWYDSYNATKHNREDALHRASLGSVIEALAAVHVMIAAQFGFDDVERGEFHADEYNFVESPVWFADSYIRPLLMPDQPDEVGTVWPHEWVKAALSF